MREDYDIQGPKRSVSIEIEKDAADNLDKMAAYKELTVSQLINTAVKRFISQHKDFLPPGKKK